MRVASQKKVPRLGESVRCRPRPETGPRSDSNCERIALIKKPLLGTFQSAAYDDS